MRRARGFTLIELLIVVVIIGVLSSIAIPKFGSTKEKAYLAAMKSDLRNLIVAEEAYFSDNIGYTTTFPISLYEVTTGANQPVIALTATGWTATLTHRITPRTCAIFIGSTALAPAVKEGEARCQ